MPATFTPFPKKVSVGAQHAIDAFLPVRVTGERRPDGSVLVYLPGGTGLVVNGDHLLYLDQDSEVAPR
jgi:hypothetical protein